MKTRPTAYNGKSNNLADCGLKWYLSAFSVVLSSIVVVILELQY